MKRLSSTVKGWRFYPSYKLKGCLPRIHGCQQKTQDVWVRGKKKCITHSTASCMNISIFGASFSNHSFCTMRWRRPGGTCMWVPFRRETLSLGSACYLPDSHPTQKEHLALCSKTQQTRTFLWTQILCPRLLLYKHSLKDNPVQRQLVPLLIKHTEMWETHGEFSPNISK